MKVKVTAVAAAILSVCVGSSTAFAGSVTQPGETVGLAAGKPLSEGVYFANTMDWGCRPASCLAITIPVVTWSTPWTLLGARVQFLAIAPLIMTNDQGGAYTASVFNPAPMAQLAWDLGNGFGFSYAFGAYFDVSQPVAFSSTSLNHRFALSYTGNDWNLTANVIYGIQLASVTNRPQISPCPGPFSSYACNADFLNVDLTGTKRFGKWELGAVGYSSVDLTRPMASYQKQSQIAVGGLLGYDFGPVTAQLYVTTDVFSENYGGYDTRGWFRLIIPLWTPKRDPAAATTANLP
jgi:hypothetical protein